MRSLCAVLLCAMSLAGAGCNREGPTSPTPPGPPVVGSPLPSPASIVRIFVSGGSWVVQGGNPLQMTAQVYTRINPDEFVDGTAHVAWTVEPSGVLTVDRQGHVTGVASGTARVIATVGDKSGSISVRSVPEFTGTWAGNYFISGCSGAPDFRTCSRLMIDQSTGLAEPVSILADVVATPGSGHGHTARDVAELQSRDAGSRLRARGRCARARGDRASNRPRAVSHHELVDDDQRGGNADQRRVHTN